MGSTRLAGSKHLAVFYCRLSLRERTEEHYVCEAKGDTYLPRDVKVSGNAVKNVKYNCPEANATSKIADYFPSVAHFFIIATLLLTSGPLVLRYVAMSLSYIASDSKPLSCVEIIH